MIKLGVTGQIASGKSTAAKKFASLGGKIISADDIGREVVEARPHILSKLIRAFGLDIVTPDGILKRRELGRRAFASEEKKQTLNAIVHPPLLKRLEEEIEACRQDTECSLIIIDAALLVDWGWHRKMDYTVCVISSREMQILRLKEKGMDDDEIRDRINAQKPAHELTEVSDFVIENNGTIEELDQKVEKIYSQIKSSQSSSK